MGCTCSIGRGINLCPDNLLEWKKDHIYVNGKEVAVVTPNPADQTAPSAPSGLTLDVAMATAIQVRWSGSTDSGGSGLAGYKIYRQLSPYAALPVGTVGVGVLSFRDEGLRPTTTYTYTVVAFDKDQNHSGASNSINVTTAQWETVPPSTPGNFTGSALSWSSVRLTWTASTDTGGSGLAGYQVFRGGILISGSVPLSSTTLDDTGLSASTTYSYTVKAADYAGNTSGPAGPVDVTTPTALPFSTIVFQDNFDRANQAGLGTSWQNSGSWSINANRASGPSSVYNDAWISSLESYFRVSIDVITFDGTSQPGVAFGLNDGSIQAYRVTASGWFVKLHSNHYQPFATARRTSSPTAFRSTRLVQNSSG